MIYREAQAVGVNIMHGIDTDWESGKFKGYGGKDVGRLMTGEDDGRIGRQDPGSGARKLPGALAKCVRWWSLCTATHKSCPKACTPSSPTSSKQAHSGTYDLYVFRPKEREDWAMALEWMARTQFGC